MSVKHYVDQVAPSGGRRYQIAEQGGTYSVTDVTEYEEEGSSFGAGDINAVCILECNYAKQGTVHKLTTDNLISENIKFFASSAFAEGDTFTFNGTAVTALTLSGETLHDGFFAGGTMVYGIKRNNVIFFQAQNPSVLVDIGTAYVIR